MLFPLQVVSLIWDEQEAIINETIKIKGIIILIPGKDFITFISYNW